MDTIGLVAHLIQQNYYILKIDLKDAYYSLKLLDEHTKYLCVTKWIGFRAKEINKIHKTPYSCLKIGGNHYSYLHRWPYNSRGDIWEMSCR